MATPIFICGQQRSGTTALQSALSHVDGVKNLGEVFKVNPAEVQNPQNFYFYLNNVLDGKLDIRSPEQAETALQNYLDYLSQLCPGSHYVVDIKYNFWHHFNPGWLHLTDCPPMMRFFKKNQLPIIHVIRNDTFRQYVSHQNALSSNKWHYFENQAPLEPHPLKINCHELAYYLELVDANMQLFRKLLTGYVAGVELLYEELFDGVELQSAATHALLKVLPGWIVNDARSRFTKPAMNPLSKVTNPEEVIDYFRNTKFGVMIIDALRPPLTPNNCEK